MSATAEITAAIIVIGDEILSGRTQDVNIHFLAKELTKLGIPLREVRVVPDVADEIVAAVNTLRQKFTYVFTTGGIGPTHDDITSASVAKAFGLEIHRHPDAVKLLEGHYAPGELTEARLKMTEVPVGATLIQNPISKAPGFKIGNVHVLAGVPKIAEAMFDAIRPTLQGGPEIHARTVSCSLGEGAIAARLSAIQDRFPDTSIGSYPYFTGSGGGSGTALVTRGTDLARVQAAAAEIHAMILDLGGQAENI
ncbi:competence/damage-inducible protein A [Lacibacterium aquatile]|uniref:Competence/damage-inducible protein A n=1 Tax=Lacibacterium aquatile TaxID=1168082 RepID=A0ABW5DNT8_9PROT